MSRGSKKKNFKHGHKAYQIEGDEEQNRMLNWFRVVKINNWSCIKLGATLTVTLTSRKPCQRNNKFECSVTNSINIIVKENDKAVFNRKTHKLFT